MSDNISCGKHGDKCPVIIKARLEYLRGEIEAERISYGEIAELQDLTAYIEQDDVQLLEWAGVPEDRYEAYQDYIATSGETVSYMDYAERDKLNEEEE